MVSALPTMLHNYATTEEPGLFSLQKKRRGIE